MPTLLKLHWVAQNLAAHGTLVLRVKLVYERYLDVSARENLGRRVQRPAASARADTRSGAIHTGRNLGTFLARWRLHLTQVQVALAAVCRRNVNRTHDVTLLLLEVAIATIIQ